ncbi:MAG: CIA30 family protein [Treponema sp.]|jgi:hypothetical protein|nr:CIA30 family protein [Treponema sp.]
MKKMTLMLAAFVFCAAMAFAQGGGGTPLNGEWELSDDSNEGGISTSTMTQVTVDGQSARRVVGNVKFGGAVQWPYISLQFLPDADGKRAMSRSRAITFKARGNGLKYWIYVATSDVKDWGFHRYSFETKVGETVEVRVPTNQLRQPDWALRKSLNLANTEYFQWGAFDTTAESAYDLTIWDVRFE